MERVHAGCGHASDLLCGWSSLFYILVPALTYSPLIQIPSTVRSFFTLHARVMNLVSRLYL